MAGKKAREVEGLELEDLRTLSPEVQDALRKRAVRAVVEEGLSQGEAGRLFGVARQVVNGWVKGYREGGTPALVQKKRGRKEKKPLSEKKLAEFKEMLKNQSPSEFGLGGVLWTRQTAGELLTLKFGLKVSHWTTGRYLRRWGFTPQKPTTRYAEQDPEAVKKWLEEDYPAIEALAEEEGADIHWGDQCGIRSNEHGGRSWAPAGETPVVDINGKRFGVNMMATLTNDGQMRLMVFDTTFNQDVFITFLERLIKHAPRKVLLILDRHRVHRSKRAQAWLDDHKDHVQLFFIPPYSPDLNPAEILNQDLKAHERTQPKPKDKDHLLTRVRAFLYSVQQQWERVANYFLADSVAYTLGF